MNSEQIEITLGVSLILRDIINELLYCRKTTPEGKEYVVDRELPFRLRYRLNKNRLVFEKDVNEFQNRRLLALAKYGEATPDGKNVVINDPQKQEFFKQEISDLIETPVTHSIIKLEPDDIELVTDTDINLSPDAMGLFIGYMTNDPELQKDLDTKINVRIRPHEDTVNSPAEPVKEDKEVKEETAAPLTDTDIGSVFEEKIEEKVEEKPKKTTTRKPKTPKAETTTEEAPKSKKTSTKKTTTKSTETKTTGETKKTTTRKPRTKKVEEA